MRQVYSNANKIGVDMNEDTLILCYDLQGFFDVEEGSVEDEMLSYFVIALEKLELV